MRTAWIGIPNLAATAHPSVRRRIAGILVALVDKLIQRNHAWQRAVKAKHIRVFRGVYMFSEIWKMLKETVLAFVDDEALSRGAAIAFYTVTSIAPVLLIVIAIAGLAFGRDAAQNAITAQLSGLMGQQTAEVLQTAVASAASKSSGIVATIVGIITLLVTASGVFGEMQTALNAIWKAKPKGTTVSRLIRARCESRISRSVGISSYGVSRCEYGADGVWQLPRFPSSVRKGHSDGSKCRRFSNAHLVPVRRHL